MNDTIKRLAMEYKAHADYMNSLTDNESLEVRINAQRLQDTFARMVANAVLDAIESEAQ
jgi:hypothetical protein